jgi:hypothetical protein
MCSPTPHTALGGASGGAEGKGHDDGPFALPPLCCIPLAAPPPEIVSEVADVTDVADFARLKLKRQRVEEKEEEEAPSTPPASLIAVKVGVWACLCWRLSMAG